MECPKSPSDLLTEANLRQLRASETYLALEKTSKARFRSIIDAELRICSQKMLLLGEIRDRLDEISQPSRPSGDRRLIFEPSDAAGDAPRTVLSAPDGDLPAPPIIGKPSILDEVLFPSGTSQAASPPGMAETLFDGDAASPPLTPPSVTTPMTPQRLTPRTFHAMSSFVNSTSVTSAEFPHHGDSVRRGSGSGKMGSVLALFQDAVRSEPVSSSTIQPAPSSPTLDDLLRPSNLFDILANEPMGDPTCSPGDVRPPLERTSSSDGLSTFDEMMQFEETETAGDDLASYKAPAEILNLFA